MKVTILDTGGMTTAQCGLVVESALRAAPGVRRTEANALSQNVTVEYEPSVVAPPALEPRLRRLSCRGLFGVGGRSGPGRQPAHRRDAEDSRSKIRGNRLDAAQFAAIVGDIAAGNYSDIHIAAFLMIETVGHLRRAALPAPVCVAVHAVFARTAYEDLEAAGAADVVNCDTIVSPSNRILLAPRICDAVRELLQ